MAVTIADKVRDQLQLHLDLPTPAERRRLREAAGLSQEEIGSIVGVTRQAVAQWESGARRNPRGQLLERYVEALRTLRECA